MSLQLLPEPPTSVARAEAQNRLVDHRKNIKLLNEKIQSAEDTLAQIVSESKCAIEELKQQRSASENDLVLTLAYIAPIRTLPQELLRHIFMLNFEDHPCCAWGLSAVCVSWRKLALSVPRLWSKVRLVTTPNATADTIRLWLERSGSTFPLDIEIFLSTPGKVTRRRSSSPIRPALTPLGTQYVHIPPPPSMMQLAQGQNPFILPPSPPPLQPSDGPPPPSPTTPSPLISKASIHWGHIAFFYLAEQMHRWERFVFRFDKHFTSINALKSLSGDAPLLKEFEVSCSEPGFFSEWTWMPSSKADTTAALPQLSSVTLQHMPFKWYSPIFQANLQALTLRLLPTAHLPLDRVLHVVAANPRLKTLDLHVGTVYPAILPLTPLTLEGLSQLSLGGHYLLSQLVDNLTLPNIITISYDIEAREPVEETITNLISRSNNPPLSSLSIAYGLSSTTFYYGAAGGVISWNFLLELPELRCLKVGGTPFEPLLNVLTKPDEDQHQWYCPKLTQIYMKGCHTHGEGVAKLVSMVGARNPSGSSSVPVDRLKHLELHECAVLGSDVIHWLKNRIPEVLCTELTYERSRSPSYGYV